MSLLALSALTLAAETCPLGTSPVDRPADYRGEHCRVLEDGSLERGRWSDGQPTGRWRVTAENGVVLESGRYADGFPTGRWTCRRLDGTTTELRFRRGVQVGERVTTWGEGAIEPPSEPLSPHLPRLDGRSIGGPPAPHDHDRSPCAPLDESLYAAVTPALDTGTVLVDVLDDHDLALAEVQVRILGAGGALPPVQTGRTDTKGRVTLGPLLPGDYLLELSSLHYETRTARLTVGPGASGLRVHATLWLDAMP